MYSSPISCRVISPMHLTGADNKTPEFRAESIKGMMRFWWRAAMQATEAATLRKQEAALFGADSDNGGQSPFKIRISSLWEAPCNQDLLPFKDQALPRIRQKQFPALCIPAGTLFNVALSARNSAHLAFAVNVFQLFAVLGGMGRRSRRGFGSFCVDSIPSADEAGLRSCILDLLNGVLTGGYKLDSATSIISPINLSAVAADYNYPNILKVHVKRSTKSVVDLCKSIHEQSHGCGGWNLVTNSQRHASPVYVSLYENNNGTDGVVRFVIVTLLNSASRLCANFSTAQDTFITQVLSNV